MLKALGALGADTDLLIHPPSSLTSCTPAQEVIGALQTLGLTLSIFLGLGGTIHLVPKELQLLL
jgi:hypothetical protein